MVLPANAFPYVALFSNRPLFLKKDLLFYVILSYGLYLHWISVVAHLAIVFKLAITAPGIEEGDRVPDLMLLIQPFVRKVLSHRLPRTYHGPNRSSVLDSDDHSTYIVNVTCFCHAPLQIGKARQFQSHARSKNHQRQMAQVGYDLVDIRDRKKNDHLNSFFKDGRCMTCCRILTKKFNKMCDKEIHIQSTWHLLSLYLQSIALNSNGCDPYAIEVQCPFLCPYRFSLLNPHNHYQTYPSSGQFATIYCNVLRLIRPELLMLNRSSNLKDMLDRMIPKRIFGDRMFSIDDVCDANGYQRPLDILHPHFKTGNRSINRMVPVSKARLFVDIECIVFIGSVRVLSPEEKNKYAARAKQFDAKNPDNKRHPHSGCISFEVGNKRARVHE